ncbi:MAG: GspH/FimT family pseudopilin [Thiobacillus sp.]|nr:GspH/FimT family pseudopilin [Thiobacillus sp.]
MQYRGNGFSLIELMITLAVLVILLTVAAPNLAVFIQNARLNSQTSELVGDLNFARSEAVKRGSPVSLCASVDGASCSGALTWETGWIVFNDANANNAVDPAELPVLRVTPALGGGNTLRGGRAVIRFGAQGYSVGFNATFRACDARGMAASRNVVVANQGRVTTGMGTASCP